ncbi:Crp/Fnr family transcriptional regulator [Rhodopirellula sp. MGV]|uniref:Crp/Fnr family transcriptional regulator n=1 Tax=Rhodopirellula sp. MGV TaxID=2023130 RepID=UPI000B96750F|nr:cyclic nucleotide-binding domain-containing protein [Rhodopirellula sp. MGV]OYP35981.1 hypothetical protein CGZ80_09475 [Rhodopirellula sp. MGV]PNY36662.1 cyclic nucleotide-binding domain-containing protein [Rhodopirellula baltica]
MLLEQTQLIQKIPICGGLKPETLRFLLEQSTEVDFAQGEILFYEGDPGDSLYVIRSGSVVVERDWNGQAIVLARVETGGCVGEMSLIDFQKRFASVRAETACSTVRVPYIALSKLCKVDTEQYAMVMMNLGREVSRRLRIAGERLFRYQQELGQQWFDDELRYDA